MALHADPGYAGEPGGGLGATLGAAFNWGGALLSLALVFGLGVWGYKLISRDATGIPIVRAETGPIRMRPEIPGGELPVPRGLAVNAIAATGAAEPPPNRIVLAPRPVVLAEEDLPLPALADVTPGTRQTGTEILRAPPQPTEEGASAPVEIARPDVIGPAASPRPRARPAIDPATIALAASVSRAVATPTEIDPATIPEGTHLVQLGAFDSAEVAQREWARLGRDFADFMVEKSRVVQRAESGGKAFYRLRAIGFADRAEARRFCAVLQDGGANCIPLVKR